MRKFPTRGIIWKSICLCIFFAGEFLLSPNAAFTQNITRSAEINTYKDPPKATEWSGHLSYIAGYKKMEDHWAPAEDQFEYGLVDFDFQKADWPVSITVQVLMSHSEQVPEAEGVFGDFSGTYEFNLGLRKIWRQKKKIQPFIGGGLSIAGASTTVQACGYCYAQTDHDSGFGYWTAAGFYWVLGQNFHTGFNLQYTYAEIQLFDKEFNAGGLHLNALIGCHW